MMMSRVFTAEREPTLYRIGAEERCGRKFEISNVRECSNNEGKKPGTRFSQTQPVFSRPALATRRRTGIVSTAVSMLNGAPKGGMTRSKQAGGNLSPGPCGSCTVYDAAPLLNRMCLSFNVQTSQTAMHVKQREQCTGFSLFSLSMGTRAAWLLR